MQFGFKTFLAAGVMAAGLSGSAASAMPIAAGVTAPQANVQVEKTAIVCLGRCYRRFGYYRPGFRPAYRAYRPYALYRPYHRFGYYR